jgi:hypothetical protein
VPSHAQQNGAFVAYQQIALRYIGLFKGMVEAETNRFCLEYFSDVFPNTGK